jgi:ABC-type nitrate/sulfonate/bicarbonate transport system substrate-binding protein
MIAPRLTTTTYALLVSLFLVTVAFAQPTKIRLASTAATSTEKVAFALAKDAGILKKHNIDLEVILITGGPVAIT